MIKKVMMETMNKSGIIANRRRMINAIMAVDAFDKSW